MAKKLLTQKQISKILEGGKLEDIDSIESSSSLLIKKRGSVLRFPKAGTPILLLLSGGIDSTVSWAKLLSDHKLHVYPVHILTGQPRNEFEQQSVRHYAQIFKKRYPKYYHEPLLISQHTTPPEIRAKYRQDLSEWIHPQIIKKNKIKGSDEVLIKREFTFPAFMPYQAVLAAQYLEYKEAVKIRTIIVTTLPTDAIYNASQSLTSLRATMNAICSYTLDWSWQLFSLAYEPEFNLYHQKGDFIEWANDNSLDLAQTYTCYQGRPQHCGVCTVCSYRRQQFIASGVVDRTLYEVDTFSYRLKAALRSNQIKLMDKVKSFVKGYVINKNQVSVLKKIVTPSGKKVHVKFKDYY